MSASLDQITSTLGFTLEDLALNRAGKLSSHQFVENLRIALTFGGLAIMAIGGVLAVFFIVRPTGFPRILYGTLSVGAAVLMTALAWREAAATMARKVLSDAGAIEFHGTGRGMVALVGHSRVNISTDALKVLDKHERYRIFYLARSNRFLSIEPMRESESLPLGIDAGKTGQE